MLGGQNYNSTLNWWASVWVSVPSWSDIKKTQEKYCEKHMEEEINVLWTFILVKVRYYIMHICNACGKKNVTLHICTSSLWLC